MYRLKLVYSTKTPALCRFDRHGVHFHILMPLHNEVFLVIPLTSQTENYQRLVDIGNLEACVDISPSVSGFETLSKHTIINHNSAFSASADELLRYPKFQILGSNLDTNLLQQLIQTLCQSKHIKRGDRKAILNIYTRATQ